MWNSFHSILHIEDISKRTVKFQAGGPLKPGFGLNGESATPPSPSIPSADDAKASPALTFPQK